MKKTFPLMTCAVLLCSCTASQNLGAGAEASPSDNADGSNPASPPSDGGKADAVTTPEGKVPTYGGLEPGSPWPMVGQSPTRQNRSSVAGPQSATTPLQLLTALDDVRTPPVIAADGTIYVGSDKSIYAVHPGGGLKWTVPNTHALDPLGKRRGVGAIGADGTLYTGGAQLCALAPADGATKWCVYSDDDQTEGLSPVIDPAGTIYVVGKGNLRATAADGKSLWKLDLGDDRNPPVIGPDGTIYIAGGNEDPRIFAVDPVGVKKWTYDFAPQSKVFGPVMASDGTVYVTLRDQTLDAPSLMAFRPDGTVKWQLRAASVAYASAKAAPVVGSDGTIYVTEHVAPGTPCALSAVDATGAKKWEFTIGNDAIVRSPIIGGDGTLYPLTVEGMLWAVTAAGTVSWSRSIAQVSRIAGAMASDGRLIFPIGPAGTPPSYSLIAVSK